jgi:uncharacterized membrane protein YgdD (TMEM256/DUF423 family)
MAISLLLGAVSAFLGVAFGAFGAHSLKAMISPEWLAVYQTGVSYQLWHSLAVVLIALLQRDAPDNRLLIWASRLMLSGIVLFSGSLYALALTNTPQLGMITPVGGVCWLIAWLLVALYGYRFNQTKTGMPSPTSHSKKSSRRYR